MGTINIVTKSASEIAGVEAGALLGSFDAYGGWLLAGAEIAFSLEGRTSNGQDGRVRIDAQTFDDLASGAALSRAPGSINAGRTDLNMHLDVSLGEHWRWRLGYQGALNVETGVGADFALDPGRRARPPFSDRRCDLRAAVERNC